MQQNDRLAQKTHRLTGRERLLFGMILLLLAWPFSRAQAEGVVYVQSVQASVLSEPEFGADLQFKVERGAELKVIEQQQTWYQVGTPQGQGWIYHLQVAANPPREKISLLASQENDLAKGARRRASSFTTSAAARGLAENRTRMNGGYWTSDMSNVEAIEELKIPQNEVIEFHQGVTQ